MKIKWCGTATLLLESGGFRLLIDPYLRGYNKKVTAPLEEMQSAEAVFITHPHLDHFCDIGAFTDTAKCIYVSENGIDHAAEHGIKTDRMQAISANERYEVGPFVIHTYQGRHCVFDAATLLRIVFSPRSYIRLKDVVSLLRQTKEYRIEDDIYVLEISDGEKRIVVLGSAGMDEDTAYPQDAALLVFPYQGRRRMDKYMLPFLDAFRPKCVMIDHFDDAFPPLTHTINTKRFIPSVKKRHPEARAFVPTEGEWYEV